MIVIDGSILVSPYFEAITRNVAPAEIVVARRYKRALQGAGELWPALVDFYEANEDAAREALVAARSHLGDWVEDNDDGFAKLGDAGGRLEPDLYRAFSSSSPDLAPQVYSFVADELVQAIGLLTPILALGDPRPTTWSLLENAFEEQCTIADLSAQEKRKRLQELNVSFAAIAGLDLWLVEVIAPEPLMWQQIGPPAISYCQFVAIDP